MYHKDFKFHWLLLYFCTTTLKFTQPRNKYGLVLLTRSIAICQQHVWKNVSYRPHAPTNPDINTSHGPKWISIQENTLKPVLVTRHCLKSSFMSVTSTRSWGRFGPEQHGTTVLRSISTTWQNIGQVKGNSLKVICSLTSPSRFINFTVLVGLWGNIRC